MYAVLREQNYWIYVGYVGYHEVYPIRRNTHKQGERTVENENERQIFWERESEERQRERARARAGERNYQQRQYPVAPQIRKMSYTPSC